MQKVRYTSFNIAAANDIVSMQYCLGMAHEHSVASFPGEKKERKFLKKPTDCSCDSSTMLLANMYNFNQCNLCNIMNSFFQDRNEIF